MFVDFPEIVIIFGVALVVLGPKKLPGTAAQVGRWVGRARAMARQFREQLEQEVSNVESALDTNIKRDAAAKPAASPGHTEPQDPQSPGEAGAVDYATPPMPDMNADMSWHPEYGADAPLAPYGDPNAIPRDPAEAQLSLALDRPWEHPAPARTAAAPPEDPSDTVQHPTGPDVR
jgi:sec-independent protein translocase protein TatB